MENKNFSSCIMVSTDAGEAMRKISKISDWWGVSFSGNAEKQGDTFVIKMGEDAFFNMTVTELIPRKRVVWAIGESYMSWYADKTEWSGTRLIFDLSEADGETTIVFTHEGLTPQSECYQDCEPGWTHWIKTSLFSYLTTGKGVFRARTK